MCMKVLLTNEECRERQLAILSEVAKLCDKHSIQYSLAYGSLIGAVRHKGFIPWDDDIDILLLRKDYEKLSDILKKQKDVSWMELLEESSGVNVFPYMKVIDNRTIVKPDDNNALHGIWIDVFPIDNLPDNSFACNIFRYRCKIKRAMILSSITDFSSQNLGKKALIKRILFYVVGILGKKRVVESYQKYVRKYEGKDSKYVGCLSSAYIEKERMEKSIFDGVVPMEFEGHVFSCLKNYDQYLSHLYGSYMQLPPEEKRKTHEIIAWRIKD